MSEIELLPCPFCGTAVNFLETDPGAPFCGYYLTIVHVRGDGSMDMDNLCPGNQIDDFIKVCTDERWERAKNYATREEAEQTLRVGWNRRAPMPGWDEFRKALDEYQDEQYASDYKTARADALAKASEKLVALNPAPRASDER